MAENTQTFILVGDFKDNITPALRKLNTEVELLTKRFTKLQTKLRPISRDMAVMADSANRISDAFKNHRGSIEGSIRALSQYRREAGRARAANEQLARSARGMPLPAAPRGGGGGGGGAGGMAAAAGGFVAGQGLANMMTGAIVMGFQKGTQIMMMPFRYGANAIGERIKDEMSDISSAGGMFAVDRRENMGIFKSFEEARQFQEQLNARLAKSAAALPGETAEYVQQSKMLTDTMMLSFSKNKEAFMKYAKTLDASVTTDREALAVGLQKFTEKAVLLGKGSGGSSAYGVPQILEMLVSQEQVNVKSFQKFAAYRSNPLFKNALEAAEKDLRKTGANTGERLLVIQKILDQALPNEVVMAMQNSADGIYQAVKSAFLDPETGLLGFGRKIESIKVPRVDALGRYVDEQGKVVDDINKAAKDSVSLFALLRDSIGGFVLPLTGLIEILPQIYDPLSGIAGELVDFRNLSQNFLKSFNMYTKDFENLAEGMVKQADRLKEMGDKVGADKAMKRAMRIQETAKARGGLLALSNLLAEFGAINESDFDKTAKLLQNPEAKLGDIAKQIFTQLFNSDFMRTVGEVVGSVVGSTLKAVGDLMAGVNDMASAGPFAKGLKKGFEQAKGAQGISLIFSNLFKLIGKALMTLFKSAPMEMSILAALTVGMPILQGAITAGLTKIFSAVAASVGAGTFTGGIGGMGATISGWLGAVGPALSLIARLLPPVAAALAGIVFLGGGVENTMRQLQQIFGEIGHTLWGSFSGLADVIGTLMAFIGDLGNGIGRLINYLSGANMQLDLLKILLFPITGALQALEIGLLGLNVVLTKVRSWMANWLGTEEEKRAAYQASVDADVKMRQSQGRQNAYNVSMQGKESLKKAMNNAIYELNNSSQLKASRSAELKSFVAEAKAQLGVKPGVTTPGAGGKPGAPAPAAASAPAVIKPESLKPVQDAITTSSATATAATNNVKAATDGVRNVATTAKTEANKNALAQHKKSDLIVLGLNNVKSAIMAVSNKLSSQSSQLTQISQNTAKTNTLLESGKLKVTFNLGGVGGKGGPGMVDQFTPVASNFGLQVTSGYRPGDPGYHGVNRARDYSNGTGPTPQMMSFAKFMASSFGGSLAELIYTPLGFSIKNGQVVPPYAQAAHYNHVHVAFGRGPGNPTLFSNPNAAMAYEQMMAPAGAKIATVTANSSEFGGGSGMNLTQNITIDGAMDPKATAEAVWAYTTQAVEKLRYNNFG